MNLNENAYVFFSVILLIFYELCIVRIYFNKMLNKDNFKIFYLCFTLLYSQNYLHYGCGFKRYVDHFGKEGRFTR